LKRVEKGKVDVDPSLAADGKAAACVIAPVLIQQELCDGRLMVLEIDMELPRRNFTASFGAAVGGFRRPNCAPDGAAMGMISSPNCRASHL